MNVTGPNGFDEDQYPVFERLGWRHQREDAAGVLHKGENEVCEAAIGA